ncbi:hypothetical protein [Microbulbifer taiwanensis]|uniref:hypothetical protein n=1 Tax=Microbulbifer taiwanensis TaxID=986746 RepID=UPI0036110567
MIEDAAALSRAAASESIGVEAAGRTSGIGPSRRLVALLGYWCLAALLISAARIWQPQAAAALENIWWGAGALLLGAALLDLLTGRRVRGLDGARQLPGNLALGVRNRVRLTLHNAGPRALVLNVCDRVPAQLSAEQLPRRAQLHPGQRVELDYPLVPHRRGQADFGGIEVLADSPGACGRPGFWSASRSRSRCTRTFSASPRCRPCPPSRACASSACTSSSAAARVWISASCASTARATASARWTGGPARGCVS